MATYTWTQVFTDTFVRANTVVGAAGTTTGLGNNWVDFGGSAWSIATNTASSPSLGFNGHQAIRPLSETPQTNPNQRIVFRFVATASGMWVGALRIQTNGDYYYIGVDNNLALNMYTIVNGGASNVGAATLTGIVYTVGSTYEIDASTTGDGTTNTTITVVVRNITAATTSQIVTSSPDTKSQLIFGGAVGLAVNGNAVAYTLFTSYTGVLVGTLTPGGIKPVTTAGTITLNGQSGQGGTAPYAYQWYKTTSADAQIVAGNLVTGATGLVLVDSTATPGTRYAYALTTVDSAATPATVKALSWSAAPSTVTNWLGIGDSIMLGINTSVVSEAQAFVNQLNAMLWPQKHTIINRGVQGVATGDWLQAAGANLLVPAVAAAIAGGVTSVMILLGTNDARQGITPATYLSNMNAIIAYIKAQIAGVKIYVNVPPFVDALRAGTPFTVAGLVVQDSYVAQIQALAATNVYVCDQTAQSFFSQHDLDMLADGVHPNDTGASVLGGLWAKGVIIASQQGYGMAVATPLPTAGSRLFRRF